MTANEFMRIVGKAEEWSMKQKLSWILIILKPRHYLEHAFRMGYIAAVKEMETKP